MKHLISFLFVIILSKSLIAQTCTISAKDAKRHVGKEVIVRGKLIEFGNSSYGQFAWFYLGPDTAHKQLKVLLQGNFYTNYPGKIPIQNYKGKEILIKGMISGNQKDIYLNASDTINLVKRKR